ncbi:hypothetical protein FACS1894187_23000 [Synergistales bacterium]|nr:hypothetical protein FACS1894187_23000 [Synergistales bacterium]
MYVMRNSKTKRGIFFGLLCAVMAFAPLAAPAAGQTITIDKPITGDVYGNGDSPDGSVPNGGAGPLQNLNGNTVEIQSKGVVDGDVYGSLFDDATGSTSASGNSVTIDGGKVDGEAYGGHIRRTDGADASAKSNDVTLNSGSVGSDIYGGSSDNQGAGQAHADGNTVTITGGTASGDIYGGSSYSDGNSASSLNNSVTISGGTIDGYISGARSDSDGDSAESLNNSVTITGGTIDGSISGGVSGSDSDSANSLNNSVTITGGTINGGSIYGGFADSDGSGMSGVASGNSVVLSDVNITGFGCMVFGGYSLVDGYGETGAATGNGVTVSGDLTLSGSGVLSVYGGFVGSGSGVPAPGTDAFTGNTLNKNSEVLVTAAGNFENISFGYTGDANIAKLDTTPGASAKTKVNIDTGSNNVNFNGTITGSGNIDKKGSGELTLTDITALTGTITLSEGAIKNATSDTIDVVVDGVPLQLASGESTNPKPGGGAGQTIAIDTAIAGDVYGNGDENGAMPLQDLNGNTVEIQSAGAVDGSVYGSSLDDTTNLPSASGNSVTIDGGQVNDDAFGGSMVLNSGAAGTSAERNRVILNSGSVGGDIYGGYSWTSGTGHARAVGNVVAIDGGTADGYIYGGYSLSYYGFADSLNNLVTVTGGAINGGFIYGGYTDSDGSGMSAVASGNSVVLSGGDIADYLLVFGGYSFVDGNDETGTATGNSVTVGGSLTLSGNGELSVLGGFVGEYSVPEPGTDAFTGNTLNKNSALSVTEARNFENVNFGYTGDANIAMLYTTPGASAKTTVNINTGSHNVNFNGIITGDGNIDKKGSGELTLTDITGLEGTITLSEGDIKNATNGPIDIIVNGTAATLAPGESTKANDEIPRNPNNGRSGGGCDAGVGVLALALLPLACAGMKRKEK